MGLFDIDSGGNNIIWAGFNETDAKPYSYHTYSLASSSDLTNQNGFKFSNANTEFLIGLDYITDSLINVLFFGSGKL